MTTPMPMTDEQIRETLWVSRRCPNAPFEPEVGRALAREVLHLRAQRDDLQARATALVEERRAAVAERDSACRLAGDLAEIVKAATDERDAAREIATQRAAPPAAPEPPPVCTGSGFGPGAYVLGSGFTGRCGICGRDVALLWTGQASVIATHPYRPAGEEVRHA